MISPTECLQRIQDKNPKNFFIHFTKEEREFILRNKFHSEMNFTQTLFHYTKGLTEFPKCAYCTNPTSYLGWIKGYSPYCSIKCQMKDPLQIEKRHNQIVTIEKREAIRKRMTGRVVSEETRQRQSIVQKGHKGLPGDLNPSRKPGVGKKISDTLKKRYAEGTLKVLRGKDNPNWKENKAPRLPSHIITKLYTWSQNVRSRDKKCSVCNESNIQHLHAHHLYGKREFPEIMLELSNGVTLCTTHHYQFHNKYGFRNNTPEQFEEFTKSFQ